jgi:hypothetical protein
MPRPPLLLRGTLAEPRELDDPKKFRLRLIPEDAEKLRRCVAARGAGALQVVGQGHGCSPLHIAHIRYSKGVPPAVVARQREDNPLITVRVSVRGFAFNGDGGRRVEGWTLAAQGLTPF